ncbi:hypothetical protein [Lutibacter sp. B1]|uniref:hypothetical protein n=1 Tax=Lutibacter sp. B1 TaxID=2725996 RepID=UPI001456F2E3|nr:hypothetical protein [Lutibacter sp. B1]NLP58778.1 hypothetical protein [Lutibacter sp. B1]
MKAIKKLSILFLSLITFYACNDDDLNVDNPDGKITEGGLLDVKNTSINYVVGNNGPYTSNIRVFQGDVKTTSIRVAKTFYTTKTVLDTDGEEVKETVVSNTVSDFKTIDVPTTDQNSMVSFTFNFSEMVEGLQADGSALSTSDTDYKVGDYWIFDYYVTTSNGERINYASTKVTVSTRFAGTYSVIEGDYWRIGVYYPDYFYDTVVIESVDAAIYKHYGISAWPSDDTGKPNDFYFTVDSDTGAITVLETDPDGNAVTLNTQPIITCENFAFTTAPCEGSNIATKNDETGEDVLQITVGYLTAGSGPREFYERLVKIVE